MAELTINEVAKQLDCSVQSIYQKKKKLMEKGMARFDEEQNLFKINESGFNYLKEARTKYLTIQKNIKENVDTREVAQSSYNEENAVLKKNVELLERIIEDKDKEISRLVKEVEAFREQNMELIINQRLFLPNATETNNNLQNSGNDEPRKGLFSRLFKQN